MKTYNEYIIYAPEFDQYYLLLSLKKCYFKEFLEIINYYVSNYSILSVPQSENDNYYFKFTYSDIRYNQSFTQLEKFENCLPSQKYKLKIFEINLRKDFDELENILEHLSKIQLNKKYKELNKLLLQV